MLKKYINGTRADLIAVASFIVLILYVTRDLVHKGMIAYADISPFPEDAYFALRLVASSWVPMHYGLIRNPIDIIGIIKIAFIVISGGNAAFAQKLYMILPLILAFVGMYFCLARFVRLRVARYITSLAYSLNPFALANTMGGATGWIYVHGLLPFIVLALLNLVRIHQTRREKVRNLVAYSLLFALAFSFGMHTMLFIMPFLVYALLEAIFSRKPKFVAKTFVTILVAMGIGITLVAIAFAPSIQFLYKEAVSSATEAKPFKPAYYYDKSLSPPLLDIMTLQCAGVLTWGTMSMVIPALILPFLAFLSPLLRKERNSFFFALLSILLIYFTYLTYLGETSWLFNTTIFRVLVVLPNEGAPSLLLAFAYSPLIARSIEELMKKISRTNIQVIALCAILICIMIANLPISIFRGDLGISQVSPAYRTYISPEFYEICGWLNQQRKIDPFFRTLWLPYSRSEVGIKVAFLDPSILVSPLRSVDWPMLSAVNLIEYKRTLLQKIIDGHIHTLGTFLAPLGVKYVILNLASQYTGKPTIAEENVIGDPKIFFKILEKQIDLKKIITTPKYLIYENLKYAPRLTASDKVVYISEYTTSENFVNLLSSLQAVGFNTRNQIFFFADQLSQSQKEALWRCPNFVLVSQLSGSDGTSYNSRLYVELDGYYRVFVKSHQAVYRLMVDDKLIGFRHEGSWLVSNATWLKRGPHKLSLQTNRADVHFEALAFISNPNFSLAEMFSPPPNAKITIQSYSFTEYHVRVESTGPMFLFFEEPYHQDWNAYLPSGEKLTHTPVFRFMNGFWLQNAGVVYLRIYFDEQTRLDFFVRILALSWSIMLAAILLTYIPESKRRFHKILLSVPKLLAS